MAEQVTGLAEEVLKIAGALRRRRTLSAAVQRDLLALRLAPVLAVHHRILYGTENVLWDTVGKRMGSDWRDVQAAALGTGGESLETGCAAAVELFRLAANSIWELLDEPQRAVVTHALQAGSGTAGA